MRAAHPVRTVIENDPESWRSRTLARLLKDLERGSALDTRSLYELDRPHFDLAMQCVANWRIDQFKAARSAG